jgi:hypothetical protein
MHPCGSYPNAEEPWKPCGRLTANPAVLLVHKVGITTSLVLCDECRVSFERAGKWRAK